MRIKEVEARERKFLLISHSAKTVFPVLNFSFFSYRYNGLSQKTLNQYLLNKIIVDLFYNFS